MVGQWSAVRARERFIFCGRLIRPWRFMPGPDITLPVAVILNLFLTDDFGLHLGHFGLLSGAQPISPDGKGARASRPGMPTQARTRERRARV